MDKPDHKAINEELNQPSSLGAVSGSDITVAQLKVEMDKLSDYERYELISEYCKYCGRADNGCQCWNDD